MFERFSERARRAVFFSWHEANDLACPQIMTEHLLLGILREDKTVANRLGTGAEESIRKELERLAPSNRERIPSSGDLPLSPEAQRALMFASEEAEALQYKTIDTAHLVLALLRVEDCTAAKSLRGHGMEYERYREMVGQGR
jgi:ATP-dependent Clp protease ATP-binding subunit ClpC